jgi:hypothetical protein
MRYARFVFLSALLGSSLALTSPAAAKPPTGGGGAVDTGQVYFERDHLVWSMNPDGTAKTALPAAVAGDFINVDAEPSRLVHGGPRWFLTYGKIPGEFYPGSNIPRHELFAMRDDGLVMTQLTTQADLMGVLGARWSWDDSVVSWGAKRWVDGSSGPAMIYAATIEFDAAGDVIGLVAQPSAPVASLTGVYYHDWSPDGTRMVLGKDGGGETAALWIADLASGTLTPLPTSDPASYPAWSPDGSRIAFTTGRSVRSIGANGAGETTLFSTPRKGVLATVSFPSWSPNGTNLVVRYVTSTLRYDVYRIPSSGGSATNLTSDLDTGTFTGKPAMPLAWR